MLCKVCRQFKRPDPPSHMCSCWHVLLKITLPQMHFSTDSWRGRSWRCSTGHTKPKPTGRKTTRLLLLGPRAKQSSRARRLEVSAGKPSKPRMCVLSVKRSCWRENSLCLIAGVWAALVGLSHCYCFSTSMFQYGVRYSSQLLLHHWPEHDPTQHYQSHCSTSRCWHTACLAETTSTDLRML